MYEFLKKLFGTGENGEPDIVNIGWHIFLNRIVTYAAIAKAS